MKNYKIYCPKNDNKDIEDIIKDIYRYNMKDYYDIEEKDLMRYSYNIFYFEDIQSKLYFLIDYFDNKIDIDQFKIKDINEFLSNQKNFYIYDDNLMIYHKFSYDDIDKIIEDRE